MKNNGFTLTELLAVITILAIIALITVPNVVGNVNNYRDKLNDTQLKNIESAAKIWGSDNLYILPDDSDSNNTCYYNNIDSCEEHYKTLIVDLQTLQNGGYISSEIKSIITKQDVGNLEISITKNGNKLDYKILNVNEY